MDSASTHLLEQISAKIRVPVLNPVNTDKSANLANVPWLFSLLPGDHILAGQLAGELEKRLRKEESSFVLVSGMDHASRLFAREFRTEMSERKLVPEFIFEFDPAIPLPWDRLKSQVDIFIILASSSESARLSGEIRNRFPGSAILGSPVMGRNSFNIALGNNRGNVIYISPGLVNPDSRFSRQFEEAVGRKPDYAEGSMYDSLILLHQAMEKSGLNRVRLMREIRENSPWEGETGIIRWDPLGQNTRRGIIQVIGEREISSPE